MDGSSSSGDLWRVANEESMMTIQSIGIDLAKNVFQIHGVDAHGECILVKRLCRDSLLPFLATLNKCTIGIEACTGAFYWQRAFEELGYKVKIIAPQYVKPFVMSQKNDRNDAEAICIALRQPNMRFVPTKNEEQQDIQAIHRARQRLVNHRTALVSQIRGLLLDRGIAIPVAITRFRRLMPDILVDSANPLTDIARETIADLYDFLLDLDKRVKVFDRKIEKIFRQNEDCQRIAKVSGVGPKTATAIVAAVGDGCEFKNGRHMAAWLGLVPRQSSSGDRQLLLGITKRGDRHLRTLLVHGARAVVRVAAKKDDPFSQWVNDLRHRRGAAKAIVAVANKNARILWAILNSKEEFRPHW
jgi:transposase